MTLASTKPWYKGGLRFECTQCGHCCKISGYVWVDDAKIAEIAAYLQMEPEQFRERYVYRVGSRLSLREKSNNECVFWRDGCQIYPVRPTQCRTFPFWHGNVESAKKWRSTARECEGVDRGRLYSAREIDRLVAGSGATDPGQGVD